MKPKVAYEYTQWQSAEEMHRDVLRWLSELQFIKDEHDFLDDLLAEYFLKLSSEEQYPETVEIVRLLGDNKRMIKTLINDVKKHNNELVVLLDGIDQPYEEREVKAQHRKLTASTDSFFRDFKELKKNTFTLVIDIMKHDKQKRLLN
ncbi:hypothetical protein ACFQ1M_16270 [Sungkyunkwania multivorans]|uniref:Uncharacterized protein n=1 Tax=Sungkyunkwania multivorans TaxID=1173618 RepID=A0ABW3D2T5_9FLAO